jgi:hypothetical protein
LLFSESFPNFGLLSQNGKNMGALLPFLRVFAQFAAGWFVNDVAGWFGKLWENLGFSSTKTTTESGRPTIFFIFLASIALSIVYFLLFKPKK